MGRIEVGNPLPGIVAAVPLEDRKVQITWRSGDVQTVDLWPALASHRAFVKLRTDDQHFSALRVSEFGDCLEWPDGAELPATWIEELADSPLGNLEFRQAMDDLNMSLDGMAARLGIARRLVADYRRDKPIPKVIALATLYLLSRRWPVAEPEPEASVRLIEKHGRVEIWLVDGEYYVYGVYLSGDPRVCQSLGMAREIAAAHGGDVKPGH